VSFSGYEVTILGIHRRILSALVGVTFTAGAYSVTAEARGSSGLNSTVVMVQSPAWTTMGTIQNNPVVVPPDISDAEASTLNDLWPRLVAFSPQTDYVEPFIQPDLSFGLQYNYQFNFELSARNASGNRLGAPDGWYQLQLAVVKKSKDSIFHASTSNETAYERFVTSTSAIVKVSGGSFARKISLRFPDVRAVANKHHLFIELIPLKNECFQEMPSGPAEKVACIAVKDDGSADATRSKLIPNEKFRPYLIEMPFVPLVTSGSKLSDTGDVDGEDIPYTDKSLADYIARSQQVIASRLAFNARRPLTASQYAQRNKLHFLRSDDPLFVAAGERWLDNKTGTLKSFFDELIQAKSAGPITVTAEDGAMFSAICQALAYKNELYREYLSTPQIGLGFSQYGDVHSLISLCRHNGRHAFRITRVTHSGQPVMKDIKRISQRPFSYNIMNNFVVSRSESYDTTASFTFKPHQILFKFLEGFGLNLGFVDFGITNSNTNSQGTSGAGLSSMMTSLDFSYVVLNIPTVGTQRCLDIRPIANTALPFYDYRDGAKNGFYICERPQPTTINVVETFAHIFERCTNSAILDCYDPLTQVTNFALRGDREISAFLYTVRTSLSAAGDNRLGNFQDFNGAEQFFAATPMTDRRIVINPVEFPNEGVPSFISKLTWTYREKFF
jgi:hypothetical protein